MEGSFPSGEDKHPCPPHTGEIAVFLIDAMSYSFRFMRMPCQGLLRHASTVQELVRRRGEHCYVHQERDTATRRWR
jgi:hypothetical protein